MRCTWCVVVPALRPQRRRCLPTNPPITDTNTEEERPMNYRPDTTDTTVQMRTMEVQGLNIFYREAGKPSRPKPGPFSFRKELANQAETELKGFVPRGVSLSRHAPMT